jgi:hypothetical protein
MQATTESADRTMLANPFLGNCLRAIPGFVFPTRAQLEAQMDAELEHLFQGLRVSFCHIFRVFAYFIFVFFNKNMPFLIKNDFFSFFFLIKK